MRFCGIECDFPTSAAGAAFMGCLTGAIREAEEERRMWVAALRKQGVKAARPDDGWVKRDKNTVFMAYSWFNDGLGVGDSLALGTPDKYRIVTIVEKFCSRLFLQHIWWRFEEVAK